MGVAITDPGALQVCTLAGVQNARGRRIKLMKVRDLAQQALQESRSAQGQMQTVRAALLILRTIKIGCDAFISIASEFAGPEGEVISGVYSGATVLGEQGGRAMSGQKVDWGKTAVGVVKAGSAVVVDDKTVSAVVDMKTIEADLVIEAYNGRTDDVIKGIL